MSFNFRKYVKELLVEQTRVSMTGTRPAPYMSSVDTTNYKEDPPGSGIYRSRTGKDPYSYSVVKQNKNKIVIKIEDAPPGRRSAVGRTFGITKNNLDDPNVQLLYASLVFLGAITTRLSGDESSLKMGSKTAEVLIVGPSFNSLNHFKEQHSRIKSLGHELSASTLTKTAPPAELNDTTIMSLSGTTAEIVEAIIAGIEKFADVQVVSMTLEKLDIQRVMIKYMAKKDSINYIHSEYKTEDTVNLAESLGEILTTTIPKPQLKGEVINISVDDSAKPSGETMGRDKCIQGHKLVDVIRFEDGETRALEAVYEFCPTREDGLYTQGGVAYEMAKQGSDYKGNYNKPVFKTETRK